MFIPRIFSDSLNLLFPNVCSGCRNSLKTGERHLCTGCVHDLPYTDFHLFTYNPVAKQFWGRVPLDNAMAMLHFKKGNRIQNIMHQLKYRSKTELGIYMGTLLGQRLINNQAAWSADCLVPVPLHRKRQKKRGYNQSGLICNGIASITSFPVSENNLIRVGFTESQTTKSRYSRFENMNSAFKVVDPSKFSGKNLILVDDVITTGATIEACIIHLLEAGASSVKVAALAYTD